MKGSKILVVLIALAMLTSVFVIINTKPVKAGKWIGAGYTPGYNFWGNATNSKTVVYNPDVRTEISINTTGLAASTVYYLFKPWYNESGGSASTLQWYGKDAMALIEGEYIKITTDASPANKFATFPGVHLDRCGLWLIDDDETHDMKNPASFKSFIWVNSSIDYTTTDPADFAYGTNGTMTITVDPGSTDDTYIYTDLYYNNEIVKNDQNPGVRTWTHKHCGTTGSRTLGLYGNITKGSTASGDTGAGNYTIKAYKDLDLNPVAYDYGTWGYSTTHNVTATGYSSNTSGPWDPPERNATDVTFRVTPGTLATSVANTNTTLYWNFSGRMDISVKDTSGDPIPAADLNCVVVNRNYAGVNDYLTITKDLGWINITNKSRAGFYKNQWGKNVTSGAAWGTNGTWKVYIWVDRNGDVTTDAQRKWLEEWNATITFKVQKAPGIQFKWIDDDGGVWNDAENDGIIPYIPSIANVPLYIDFQVIGDDHTYFGAAGQTSAMENITLSGNAIFTGTLDKIPGVSYDAGGTWTVPVIPTMSQGGGTITITATWEDQGTVSEKISIGGTSYLTNGSIVTVTPSEFKIGTDQTFTVDVKDASGSSNKYARAYLYYIGDADGGTNGKPIVNGHISIDSNGYDGYTLGFNTTQQRANQTGAGNGHANFGSVKAPRNLTAYIVATNAGYGYARVQMKPETSLNVVTYPTTWLAGYEYDNLYINITVVTTGNTTLLPDEDDTADMNVRIFDQDDNDVTDTIGSFTAAEIKADIDDTYKIELPNEYITTAGTYRVYAYNKTHNSEGHNATLVVKQAKVECDKSPFIWKYDDNISATFTVTDEVTGDLLAGTLLIDNMTWTDAKYNRTWTNTSFDGSADQGGNNSVELGESEGFTDGKVTVNDITADFLPTGVAEANITFWFRPELADGSDGVYARAKGIVKVTVPAVAVDKQYVSVGKTTTVVATVTGRGETIDDVFVRLHGRGIDQNGTSGADGSGKVSFSILPTSTGNISIDVGEAGRTVTTKILVTAWALEISTDPQVDEGGTITVTALKEGTTTPVENADITFNQVTKTTDSNGQVTFTAPAVTSDRTYTIEATAAGYLPDSTTITVINVPKLTIVPPSGEIYGTETFTVTVADDEGQGKVGAKVTFNGDDYYTGAGGAVTITAPDVKETSKQYTLTATLAGFTDATPITITINKTKGGVPGFELLTLIAAIGVAFILLRRRRN